MIADNTADPEAELWVIQSMVLDANAADYALTHITEADFTDQRHAVVFRHLAKLLGDGKRFDTNLFVRSMKEATNIRGKSDFDAVGGFDYLTAVVDGGVTSAHIRYYLARVRRATASRRLKEAATAITAAVEGADPEEPADELASRCEQMIFDATDRTMKRESVTSAKDATATALDRLDFRIKHGAGEGLQSGFHELDKMTGGFRPGEMIVIAARPGCGKSAMATNIAEHASQASDGTVLLVSLEMSSDEIADRMLSSVARVPLYQMRNGTLSAADRMTLLERSGVLAAAKLSFEDAPTRTVAQIASTARMVARKGGLSLIIVDYLQLVLPDNGKDPRQEQVAKISRKFKAMAREMKVPVICLAQLNRQADDPSKAPRLSQLRESGAIEQDADVVIFIHRPPTTGTSDSEEAELHVAKQRNGPTGVAKVTWYRHYCRFDNAEEKWVERREPAFAQWNGSPEQEGSF